MSRDVRDAERAAAFLAGSIVGICAGFVMARHIAASTRGDSGNIAAKGKYAPRGKHEAASSKDAHTTKESKKRR